MRNISYSLARYSAFRVFILLSILLFLLLFLGLSSCKDEEVTGPENMNLKMLAESRPDELSAFLAAMEMADLSDMLTNENHELTIFAPHNETLNRFLEQAGDQNIPQDQLGRVLKYHMVQGRILATQLNTGSLNNLNETALSIQVNQVISINNTASIIVHDLVARNGVIHIIDEILLE